MISVRFGRSADVQMYRQKSVTTVEDRQGACLKRREAGGWLRNARVVVCTVNQHWRTKTRCTDAPMIVSRKRVSAQGFIDSGRQCLLK